LWQFQALSCEKITMDLKMINFPCLLIAVSSRVLTCVDISLSFSSRYIIYSSRYIILFLHAHMLRQFKSLTPFVPWNVQFTFGWSSEHVNWGAVSSYTSCKYQKQSFYAFLKKQICWSFVDEERGEIGAIRYRSPTPLLENPDHHPQNENRLVRRCI
jgi:hypothetical protein